MSDAPAAPVDGDDADTPSVDELLKVVALDGPAGSGKSTVSRLVAAALGWRFVDTGATYRAVTLAVLRAGADPEDPVAAAAAVEQAVVELDTDPNRPGVRLDGLDVSREIRSAEVTAHVSAVSAVPAVRRRLVVLQRRAMGTGGAVVEGRDIATVVAPRAAVKVYLDARPEVRAARRAGEGVPGLGATRPAPELDLTRGAPVPTDASTDAPTGQGVATSGARDPHTGTDVAAVALALAARDERDSQTNALQASDGAIHLDTSDLSLDEVVDAVVALVRDAGLVA